MFKVSIICLFVLFMYPCLTGCGHAGTQTSKATKDTATCMLFGDKTMTYYYGDSANRQEEKEGNIYDHVFMSNVLTSIKKHSKNAGFKVDIMPVASADVMANLSAVIDIFNTNDIQNRYVDPEWLALVRQPLKLNFPVEDSTTMPVNLGKDDITLILNKDNIYAYKGKEIKAGEKHTYETIDQYLKNELKTGHKFIVVIKPSDDSSYRNVVDALDEMKINNIEKYSLVEITKEEATYIKTLK